jgi:hypothetical protein
VFDFKDGAEIPLKFLDDVGFQASCVLLERFLLGAVASICASLPV